MYTYTFKNISYIYLKGHKYTEVDVFIAKNLNDAELDKTITFGGWVDITKMEEELNKEIEFQLQQERRRDSYKQKKE